VAVMSLGPQPLRGLPAPIELIQLLPQSLQTRRFPPLRLDAPETAGEEDIASNAMEGNDTASIASSLQSSKIGIEGIPARADVMAKRSDGRFTGEELMNLMKLFRTLLAPGKPAEQQTVIAALASLWRIKFTAAKVTPQTKVYRTNVELQLATLNVLSRTLLAHHESDNNSSTAASTPRV
jgi:hypothetical protein